VWFVLFFIYCVVLQGKHGVRVCESGVQGEVFGSKGNEVTGDWRKLLD
jgi:hypothetical protein